MEPTSLSAVRKLEEYRAERTHIFASPGSLEWFVRKHRADLVERGALVLLTGTWHAHEPKFDAYVMEAGAAAAAKLAAA